jgi:hypothetical protein
MIQLLALTRDDICRPRMPASGDNSTLAMLPLRQLPLDLAQLLDIHHVLAPASSGCQTYQVVDVRHRNRKRPDKLGDSPPGAGFSPRRNPE